MTCSESDDVIGLRTHKVRSAASFGDLATVNGVRILSPVLSSKLSKTANRAWAGWFNLRERGVEGMVCIENPPEDAICE